MIIGPKIKKVKEKRNFGPRTSNAKRHPHHQQKLTEIVPVGDGRNGWKTTLYSPGVSTRHRYGDKTGALRAPEPVVFRRFGNNTRERCYPLPDTGILDNVYTWPPARGHDPPCQLLSGLVPCQAGNPKINERVPLLKKGSIIWNCMGKKSH